MTLALVRHFYVNAGILDLVQLVAVSTMLDQLAPVEMLIYIGHTCSVASMTRFTYALAYNISESHAPHGGW